LINVRFIFIFEKLKKIYNHTFLSIKNELSLILFDFQALKIKESLASLKCES